MRQNDFAHMLVDLTEKAYLRYAQHHGKRSFDMQAYAEMPDVSREDNQVLAQAARQVVQAFD